MRPISTEQLVRDGIDGLEVLKRLTLNEAAMVDTYQVRTASGVLGVLKLPSRTGIVQEVFEKAHNVRARVGAQADAACVAVLQKRRLHGSVPIRVCEWAEGESMKDPFLWFYENSKGGEEREKVKSGFQFAIGALEACRVIHGLQLVHRDIKPDNVIFDASGRARLIDLDTMMEEEEEPLLAVWSRYAPNETDTGSLVSSASDIYTVACATVPYLGAMAIATTDIFGKTQGEMKRKRRRKIQLDGESLEMMHEFAHFFPEEVQDQVHRLVDLQAACLRSDQEDRPKAEEALQILTERRNLQEI